MLILCQASKDTFILCISPVLISHSVFTVIRISGVHVAFCLKMVRRFDPNLEWLRGMGQVRVRSVRHSRQVRIHNLHRSLFHPSESASHQW
jgi:hypothetical protein